MCVCGMRVLYVNVQFHMLPSMVSAVVTPGQVCQVGEAGWSASVVNLCDCDDMVVYFCLNIMVHIIYIIYPEGVTSNYSFWRPWRHAKNHKQSLCCWNWGRRRSRILCKCRGRPFHEQLRYHSMRLKSSCCLGVAPVVSHDPFPSWD